MLTDKTKQALDEARRERLAKKARGYQRDMDDESINAKHLRIRGTLDYKYPPPESACKSGCGAGDDKLNKKTSDHRCVLAIGHEGDCMWSWECLLMRGSNVSA